MEFQCNVKDILNGMTIGSAFSGKNKALPILDNILVDVNDGYLTITSYDTENMVSVDVGITINDGVGTSFCIEPNKVISYLKLCKDEVIVFKKDEKESVILKHSGGKIRLPIFGKKDYPIVSDDSDNSRKIVFNSSSFAGNIQRAVAFTGKDPLKVFMNGVHIVISNKSATMFASDGFFLFKNEVDCKEVECEDCNVSINARCIPMLVNVCSSCGDYINASFNDRNMTFYGDGIKLRIGLLDCKIPNFNAIIPSDFKGSILCKKDSILDSIRRCSIASSEANNRLVKLNIEGGVVYVSGEEIETNTACVEVVNCQSTMNDKFTIGFSYRVISNCLSCIYSEYVTLNFVADNKPCIISDDGCVDKALLLAMPVMLKS